MTSPFLPPGIACFRTHSSFKHKLASSVPAIESLVNHVHKPFKQAYFRRFCNFAI
jgi:hypothetical protein